jgi:hypothetical protein
MCEKVSGLKIRSIEKLVLTATRLSVEGLEASASVVQIVKSLVLPFIARRSLLPEVFPGKEFGRFVSSMRITAKRIQMHSSEDNKEQTYCKYWLDVLLCGLFQDKQLPAQPDWITLPLFTGWLRRAVLRALVRRDVSFIYSLQKGSKLAWPVLGETKKRAALRSHYDRLNTNRGAVPDDVLDVIQAVSVRLFYDSVEKTQREGSWSKFLPSSSACFQAGKRDGGALGLFDGFDLDLTRQDAKVIGKLPYLARTLNEWRTNQFGWAHTCVKRDMCTDEKGDCPLLDVKVMAIPEPGKFRIITKGNGYLYSYLQPLQGVLLDSWKKSYASTMTIDVEKRVQEMDEDANFEYWCSVDYEAATDLLKKDASVEVIRSLPNNDFLEAAWLSLASGRAFYPWRKMIGTTDEGQLMGHPLSFPLLCAINLAVYEAAIDRWILADPEDDSRKRLGAIMLRNVLVNGDDMLFKCQGSFYPIFLETTATVGFKISQGKNYLSKDVCMINSNIFRRTNGTMKRYGYLNQRILLGNNIKEGRSNATPSLIGKDLSAMCEICPWAVSCIPLAFSRWSQDWFGQMYRPNWFLPVHLGGFGVDPKWASPDWRISPSQRELAARFVDNPELALYRLKSLDIPTAKIAGAMANWRMIAGPYVPNSYESVDDSDEWLSRLAYAAQAAHGTEMVSDRVMISRLGRERNHKPRKLSLEAIELYSNEMQFFATKLPPCPPLSYIVVPRD